MPRFGGEGDAGQVFGSGEDVALSGDQRSAEGGIEEIFLGDFPGGDLADFRTRKARLAVEGVEALPGNGLFGGGGAHEKAGHGLLAFLNFRGRLFSVKASYESVFDLMGITENVALVEMEHLREIVDSGHDAIDGARLDDVLPLVA